MMNKNNTNEPEPINKSPQSAALAAYQRRIAFEQIINALIAVCCLAYIIALMTLCGII